MAIDRRLKRLVVGFNRVKYVVRLTSDICEPHTDEAARQQSLLREAIHHDQRLLACGPAKAFDRMSIWHDGNTWVCEAWAEVDEATE